MGSGSECDASLGWGLWIGFHKTGVLAGTGRHRPSRVSKAPSGQSIRTKDEELSKKDRTVAGQLKRQGYLSNGAEVFQYLHTRLHVPAYG